MSQMRQLSTKVGAINIFFSVGTVVIFWEVLINNVCRSLKIHEERLNQKEKK